MAIPISTVSTIKALKAKVAAFRELFGYGSRIYITGTLTDTKTGALVFFSSPREILTISKTFIITTVDGEQSTLYIREPVNVELRDSRA